MPSTRVHRILRFRGTDGDEPAVPPMTGGDVVAVQKAINARGRGNAQRGLTRLVVDGQAGRQTIAVGRKAAASLGVDIGESGLGKRAQTIIRRPWLRVPSEYRRQKRWLAKRAKERAAAAAAKPARKDNKITGAVRYPRLRVVFACLEAARLYYSGVARRFYSQPGTWTVELGITGEHAGQRSDCSQLATSMCWSAGLPDPNGNSYKGGYTGTLVAHLKEIGRDDLQPGDFVLYGLGTAHHIEVWVGNGDGKTSYRALARAGSTYRDRTVGHGSPPVDFGDIDMVAGARFFRIDL